VKRDSISISLYQIEAFELHAELAAPLGLAAQVGRVPQDLLQRYFAVDGDASGLVLRPASTSKIRAACSLSTRPSAARNSIRSPEHLFRAGRAELRRPGLHVQIGEALIALRRWAEAEQAFRRQLKQVRVWLAKQPNVKVLFVPHREAIEDPRSVAERVSAFLGGGLDTDAMAVVVDSSLYRQRASV
jgi:hypothetical protein